MAFRVRASQRLPLALLAGASLLCLAPLSVQAQEVVQPLPDPAAAVLNSALQRLARDPLSVPALVEAGKASLTLNDVDAALGFYNRAQAVAPSDGAVLAGLAQVSVRRGEAPSAIQLFDSAEAAGVPMAPLAAERGLAYDLVGENAQAQRLYLQALSQEADPEVSRRLALSYAISGNAAASEEVLLPLLQRQDRAAYRSRAFALAILGRQEEAVTIAETMLPAQLADRLEPYLRYMPRLTPPQQAAAVNLGRFPAASQMARDDARLAAVGIDAPVAARGSGPDQRLIPGGAPLGQAAPPPPAPPPPPPAPVLARAEPPRAVPAPRGELPPRAAASVPPAPARTAEPPITVLALDPPPPAPPSEPEPERIELAEAFAEFAAPRGSLPRTAAAGAVDITRIQITRERPPPPPPPPAPPPPPPPPAHPSRHWVQVATGQDTAAFRFDLRRIRREAGGLLDLREAFQARWGQSNRLLIGPFPSAAAANSFVAQLNEKGLDSFRFTSAAGEEVRPLP
jgi:Flp pilus assembly protein TadD